VSMLCARLAEERWPDRVVRTIRFTGPASPEEAVWWEVTGDVLPGPLRRHDLVAVALIFAAMRKGCDLHIAGPVSWSLLAHLDEFQSAWTRWRPDLYCRVAVSADDVVMEEVTPNLRAVTLFSGGVDATFTLWRHQSKKAGHASRDIITALMVHGFDIPLSAEAAFEQAASATRETLEPIGVPLTRIRTNWRSAVCGKWWEMEFAAGLVACLRQFQGDVAGGLIGSGVNYGHLVMPWGENPVTVPLLSSDDFEIIYDGCGSSRTDKVAAIAEWGAAAERLRVCWEGPVTGRNCGVCEKCVRTKLNFMAAGKPLPEALSNEPTSRQILQIDAKNDLQIWNLADILAVARRNRIDAPWVSAVARLIRKKRALQSIRMSARRMSKLIGARRALKKGRRALKKGYARIWGMR
jgi:hypothetical protein